MQYKVSELGPLGLPVWQSEHKCGNYWWEAGYKTTAPNNQAYAIESWTLLRDWIKAGVSAYFSWNMVLDTVGASIDSRQPWAQNALLTVDTTAKALVVTPTYYVPPLLAVRRTRGQARRNQRRRRQEAPVCHACQWLGDGKLRPTVG
ncbi:MAG: hypothetical protein QM756_34800 [Polyangiaceae bacterium]